MYSGDESVRRSLVGCSYADITDPQTCRYVKYLNKKFYFKFNNTEKHKFLKATVMELCHFISDGAQTQLDGIKQTTGIDPSETLQVSEDGKKYESVSGIQMTLNAMRESAFRHNYKSQRDEYVLNDPNTKAVFCAAVPEEHLLEYLPTPWVRPSYSKYTVTCQRGGRNKARTMDYSFVHTPDIALSKPKRTENKVVKTIYVTQEGAEYSSDEVIEGILTKKFAGNTRFSKWESETIDGIVRTRKPKNKYGFMPDTIDSNPKFKSFLDPQTFIKRMNKVQETLIDFDKLEEICVKTSNGEIAGKFTRKNIRMQLPVTEFRASGIHNGYFDAMNTGYFIRIKADDKRKPVSIELMERKNDEEVPEDVVFSNARMILGKWGRPRCTRSDGIDALSKATVTI